MFRVRTKDGTTAIYFPKQYADALREFLVANGLAIQPTSPEPYTLTNTFGAFVACARINVIAPVAHELVEVLVAKFAHELA